MSAALAAMLKKRSDNGLIVLTESNAPQVEVYFSVKRPSITQTTISKGPKCFICEKSVFKMEEIIAIGHAYHGACFTCGGTNTDGCKKKLVRDGFLENKGQPYCKTCHDKNFKVGVTKGVAVNNLLKSRPISVMLWGRKNKQGSEDANGTPEVPAYVLASKKAVEEVNTVTPSWSGRSCPPAPGSSQKRPTFMPVTNANKCGACNQTVFKMEEVIAIGKSWHSGCFCCGGPNGTEGCKRKLVRDNYSEHKEVPYCQTCYDKLFKSWVKDTKAASTLTLEKLLINKRSSFRLIAKNFQPEDNRSQPPPPPRAPPAPSVNESSDQVAYSVSIAERVIASNTAANAAHLFTPKTPIKNPAGMGYAGDASTVPITPVNTTGHNKSYIIGKTTAFNGANKCIKCAKTVYKTEEIIAVGQVWHTTCFCCGGLNKNGCNKTLTRDNYVDHNTQPYCNSCYSKLFRIKGFGYGNTLNTDYGGAN